MALKVNVGCGASGRADWINLDWGILAILHRAPLAERALLALKLFPGAFNVAWPENLRLHNCAKKPLPFADGSVDFIYTSHFLEHLKLYDAERAVRDYCRALRPGGRIRIVVPDLEEIARKYVTRDRGQMLGDPDLANDLSRTEPGAVPSDFVNYHFYHVYNMKPPSLVDRLQAPFIRPHQWMYDFDSMRALLESAGFSKVVRCEFGVGDVPDARELDTHPHDSLHVEATRP
jgi:SAM-dependent methyltransferase